MASRGEFFALHKAGFIREVATAPWQNIGRYLGHNSLPDLMHA
jgi:hypothetical protein